MGFNNAFYNFRYERKVRDWTVVKRADLCLRWIS